MLFDPVKPMLLQTNDIPFDDANWIHELKLDGWRLLLYKQGERIEAFTRHGLRLTPRLPESREVAEALRSHEAILDCEGVCYRDGKTMFEDFAYRGRLSQEQKIVHAARIKPASFVAFDVLYDGQDLTQLPLLERKKRLSELVQSNSVLSTVAYFDGDNGTTLCNWAERVGGHRKQDENLVVLDRSTLCTVGQDQSMAPVGHGCDGLPFRANIRTARGTIRRGPAESGRRC